jgi:hypothetical protein
MRNIFLSLLTALVFLLGACSTTTPQPQTCAEDSCNPDGGDNGGTDGGDNGGGDNGGGDAEPTDNTGGGGNNGGGNNGGGNNGGTTPPAPVYDPSLMKGFVANYKGDKVLTVKSLWINQSNGQIIDLGTDPMARLEQNGEFGVRLSTPADDALASVPLPVLGLGGCVTTTTVPQGLTDLKGALVPALFVFDGDQLVGLIIHGSYHLDKNGNIVPKAKLAMRVYSASDKIIAKGECAASVGADALAANYDAIVGGLASLGVNSPDINNALGELAMLGTPAVDVNLSVDVGLKKGWNTVVLGAELSTPMMTAVASAEPAPATLNVTLIDDTQPNFTWYYLDLTQFVLPMDK